MKTIKEINQKIIRLNKEQDKVMKLFNEACELMDDLLYEDDLTQYRMASQLRQHYTDKFNKLSREVIELLKEQEQLINK